MKYLYGFMQDKKWYEDVGHILIGLIPFVGWGREHSQWPPGWPYYALPNRKDKSIDELELVTQLDRVEDSYRDFLGYEIGSLIRTIILVVLCIMFS